LLDAFAMGQILRVRDVMTPDVVTLGPEDRLSEAARVLTTNRLSGAPVVEQGQVIGILSCAGLVDPLVGTERGVEGKVRDAMTPVPWAVRPGDAAIVAVELMLAERVHRAIVVDGRGELLGIVTPTDVLRGLVEGGHLEEWAEATRRYHNDPATGVGYVSLGDLAQSRQDDADVA
jgi:predicted transcriptional regulator